MLPRPQGRGSVGLPLPVPGVGARLGPAGFPGSDTRPFGAVAPEPSGVRAEAGRCLQGPGVQEKGLHVSFAVAVPQKHCCLGVEQLTFHDAERMRVPICE